MKLKLTRKKAVVPSATGRAQQQQRFFFSHFRRLFMVMKSKPEASMMLYTTAADGEKNYDESVVAIHIDIKCRNTNFKKFL